MMTPVVIAALAMSALQLAVAVLILGSTFWLLGDDD